MESVTLKPFDYIRAGLRHAKFQIATIGVTYLLFVGIGSIMVHESNSFALNYRDKLVTRAVNSDPASIAFHQGNNLTAAIFDFGENLFLGAIPQTITGLTIISPYGFAAYRGWVGGVVTVDSNHQSRFASFKGGFYLILTLILQLIPYTLAGGIGVKLGLTYFRSYPEYLNQKKWLGYPAGCLEEVAWVYVLIVPLFFIASLWEFLSTWN